MYDTNFKNQIHKSLFLTEGAFVFLIIGDIGRIRGPLKIIGAFDFSFFPKISPIFSFLASNYFRVFDLFLLGQIIGDNGQKWPLSAIFILWPFSPIMQLSPIFPKCFRGYEVYFGRGSV